jgi:hypothetical protein
MDLIEPEFRPKYESICVGNKPAHAQNVFFEGMLLEEGLGKHRAISIPRLTDHLYLTKPQATISHGTVHLPGVTPISIGNLFVASKLPEACRMILMRTRHTAGLFSIQ